jgi:hypothetical protein
LESSTSPFDVEVSKVAVSRPGATTPLSWANSVLADPVATHLPRAARLAGIVAGRRPGYRERMTTPDPTAVDETAAMLAAAGIVVTDAGRQRARAELAAARERVTPEALQRLRDKYRPNRAA